MTSESCSADKIRSAGAGSAHGVKQPTIANRKRPFPELPQPRRPIGRKKDEFGPTDQVLGRDVANRGKNTAILRIVAIVTHHEVIAGRYVIHLSVVEGTIVAHLDDPMLHAIWQSFDILGERDHRTIAFAIKKILDAPARTWLIIDVEDAVFHLNMIARKADQPLDVIGRIVGRQLEHDHVAALGRMEEYPPRK